MDAPSTFSAVVKGWTATVFTPEIGIICHSSLKFYVDREIEKLKKKQQELEQRLGTETDEAKIKDLERQLAQVLCSLKYANRVFKSSMLKIS